MAEETPTGLARIARALAGELKPALLSFGYFFFVLACYYVLFKARRDGHPQRCAEPALAVHRHLRLQPGHRPDLRGPGHQAQALGIHPQRLRL